MPSEKQENGNGGRPQNSLLHMVGARDYKALRPYLDLAEVHSGEGQDRA